MVDQKEELQEWDEQSIIARQSLEGVVFGVGGGISGCGQPATANLNSVDEATPDAMGNPLPQFQGALSLENEELPKLVMSMTNILSHGVQMLSTLFLLFILVTLSMSQLLRIHLMHILRAKRKVFQSLFLILWQGQLRQKLERH